MGGYYDIILTAETIYNEDSQQRLLDCIKQVCAGIVWCIVWYNCSLCGADPAGCSGIAVFCCGRSFVTAGICIPGRVVHTLLVL
jgi:hypothetical protein